MTAHATTPAGDLASGSAVSGRGSAARATGRIGIRVSLGVVAALLIVAGAFLPLWEASLSAPQYPAGLHLTAYGSGRVIGDIREINELNHYVGMQAFQTGDVPEVKLFLPATALALIGVGIATAFRRRLVGKLAVIGLWLVPLGVLADVQFRLYLYGHSVKPDAAIRLNPFTPLVVGPTHVLNFTTWAYPGNGTLLFFAAAALVTWGEKLPRIPALAKSAWDHFGSYDEDDEQEEAEE